jgi:hypothetical protein
MSAERDRQIMIGHLEVCEGAVQKTASFQKEMRLYAVMLLAALIGVFVALIETGKVHP